MSARREFQEETGIHVEGELCPLCALTLREKHQGDIYKVPVRRIFFSEKERCGIGTFVPSDPKSQDIAELVGSIDLSTIGDYGSESDPRAYRFDGELNVANRGLMEFIEMLKADERFLYVLLTLSQEKNIKTGRFPLIYADECVISHTNETEFNEFLGNKKSEALHDRMIMVRIPYNLKVSQEERIYQKLLRATSLEGVHIAPHTLRVAAIFAILSRLEEPKMSGLTLLKKLKLYDGEDVEGFRQKFQHKTELDVRRMRRLWHGELGRARRRPLPACFAALGLGLHGGHQLGAADAVPAALGGLVLAGPGGDLGDLRPVQVAAELGVGEVLVAALAAHALHVLQLRVVEGALARGRGARSAAVGALPGLRRRRSLGYGGDVVLLRSPGAASAGDGEGEDRGCDEGREPQPGGGLDAHARTVPSAHDGDSMTT